MPLPEPLGNQGRDQSIEADSFEFGSFDESSIESFGHLLPPLTTGRSRSAGLRNRVAKFLEGQ